MVELYELEGVKYQIKKDPTRRNKYYCVMQNPFRVEYDTAVLCARSVNALKNKINRQYKKFIIRKGR